MQTILVSAQLGGEETKQKLRYFERLNEVLQHFDISLVLLNLSGEKADTQLKVLKIPRIVYGAHRLPLLWRMFPESWFKKYDSGRELEELIFGLDRRRAELKLTFFRCFLHELFKEHQPRLCILWNSFTPFHRVFADYCRKRSVPVLFAEYGVLPGTVCQVGDRFTYSGYVWPTLPAEVSWTVKGPDQDTRSFLTTASRVGYFHDPTTKAELPANHPRAKPIIRQSNTWTKRYLDGKWMTMFDGFNCLSRANDFGIPSGQTACLCHLIDKIGLGHVSPQSRLLSSAVRVTPLLVTTVSVVALAPALLLAPASFPSIMRDRAFSALGSTAERSKGAGFTPAFSSTARIIARAIGTEKTPMRRQA